MTLRTLLRRSLRFHWRGHLGVLLGAAVGSAALIGALVIGDSVRGSLREMALQRLGWVDAAMAPTDRFFTQELGDKLGLETSPGTNLPVVLSIEAQFLALLKLPGTAARQDGTARANQVNVLGVPRDFWHGLRASDPRGSQPALRGNTAESGRQEAHTNAMDQSLLTSAATGQKDSARIAKGAVVLNEALAAQLNARPGDDIVLRVHKPTALSREVPITPQSEASIALRLKVHAIADAAHMGNFSLQANQAPPLNAFLNRDELADAAGLKGKANLILAGEAGGEQRYSPGQLAQMINQQLSPSLPDFGVTVRVTPNQNLVELTSDRIFIEPTIAAAIFEPETNRWSRSNTLIGPDVAGILESQLAQRRAQATNSNTTVINPGTYHKKSNPA